MLNMEAATFPVIMYKVVIDGDVFHSGVKHRIHREISCSNVVTKDLRRRRA